MYKWLPLSVVLFFCSCNKTYKTLNYGKAQVKLPYVKTYTNANKKVLVYGSYHTNNPADNEINDIQHQFQKFNPDIILYEGNHIGVELTMEKSISYYYEMGLVRWLARKHNIQEKNIEPHTKYIYSQLKQSYTTDILLLATVLGQNSLFIKQHTKEDFEELYPVVIRDIEEGGLVLTEEQKEVAYFYALYDSFYHKSFEPETFDYRTTELSYDISLLNKVIRSSADYRDQHMLRVIDSVLNHYNKVYVQIGGRHAIVWQPALKKIIKKKR